MRLHIELPDSFPYNDAKAILRPLDTLRNVKYDVSNNTKLGIKHIFHHETLSDLVRSSEFRGRVGQADFLYPKKDKAAKALGTDEWKLTFITKMPFWRCFPSRLKAYEIWHWKRWYAALLYHENGHHKRSLEKLVWEILRHHKHFDPNHYMSAAKRANARYDLDSKHGILSHRAKLRGKRATDIHNPYGTTVVDLRNIPFKPEEWNPYIDFPDSTGVVQAMNALPGCYKKHVDTSMGASPKDKRKVIVTDDPLSGLGL